MTTENDLSVDFYTHLDNKTKPIFHRIKFHKVSFYLTKSIFHDLAVSRNKHGNYRIFSWDDWRSKRLLGLELGEDNPVHGRVNLIGHFSPTEDDLEDVQYHSDEGRTFYPSARDLVAGRSQAPTAKKKINAYWADFRMKEIIPTGAQGKAVYGEGSYIIDGPAGTGKSTTALQRIKLLEKHYGVSVDRVLVVVKNRNIIYEFKELLKSININGVRVETVDDFISRCIGSGFEVSGSTNAWAWKLATTLSNHMTSIKQELRFLSNRQFNSVGKDDGIILNSLRLDKEAEKSFKEYVRCRNEAITSYQNKKNAIDVRQKEINNEISKYISALEEHTLRKKRPKIRLWPSKKNMVTESAELTADERMNIKEKERQKRKDLEHPLLRKKRELNNQAKKKVENIEEIYYKIRSRVSDQGFMKRYAKNSIELTLLNLHINKFLKITPQYHTVIVDEAQDISKEHLHVLWLNGQNIILTGDEMQAEAQEGIQSWNNLGKIKNDFYDQDGLKVFSLQNNFRQTGELGSCSHNFRQLVLGRPLVDISNEYFENQKGFPRPQLARIRDSGDFRKLIASKIQLAQKRFKSTPPVVIVYENSASFRRLSQILEDESIAYGHDGDESKDIMFVPLSNIAGRGFPLLLAPLIDSTGEKSLYVMLSRARFDLCLFTGSGRAVNENILKLVQNGFMSYFDFDRD